MTLAFSNVIAKDDKNDDKQKKDKDAPVQQVTKPTYYEPYNTPSNKGHGKDYNSNWGKKTDDVKEKKEKKDKDK
jgi:hypothetical protein